jgi:hypothetical protein
MDWVMLRRGAVLAFALAALCLVGGGEWLSAENETCIPGEFDEDTCNGCRFSGYKDGEGNDIYVCMSGEPCNDSEITGEKCHPMEEDQCVRQEKYCVPSPVVKKHYLRTEAGDCGDYQYSTWPDKVKYNGCIY